MNRFDFKLFVIILVFVLIVISSIVLWKGSNTRDFEKERILSISASISNSVSMSNSAIEASISASKSASRSMSASASYQALHNEAVKNLIIEDLKTGTGKAVATNDKVKVHYVGKLKSTGAEFDSSRKEGREPFTINKIGSHEVIEGWELGLIGMKVGGIRKLTIPSILGYGEAGSGNSIPPNSDLIFEIELLELTKQ